MHFTPGTPGAILAADAIRTVVPSSRGATAVVHDWGGEGPPLLFAHATGLHGYVWAPMAMVLREQFRCLAIDVRGHGSARRPVDGHFGWDGFGDDVEHILDCLGLSGQSRAYGVGHSMGANALVQGELRRPGTFRHLFLFEAIISPPYPGQLPGTRFESPISEGARRRRSVFASREEAFRNFAAKAPFNGVDADCLRAYVDHGFVDQEDGTVRLACAPEDEAEVFSMSMTDVFERAVEVACPATVAAGSRTEDHHAVRAVLLARRLPAAQYLEVPHRTHFGPLEHASDFAALVADCLHGRDVSGLRDPAGLPDPPPLVPPAAPR